MSHLYFLVSYASSSQVKTCHVKMLGSEYIKLISHCVQLELIVSE